MVNNIGQLRRALDRKSGIIRKELVKQLEREAEKVVRQMRILVPRDKGDLAASIGWTWGGVPPGAVTIGRVGRNEYEKVAITIYAGGTEATKRRQNRSSGTRARDRHRSGAFDTDNARFQEFGTVNMPANPFFFPAYRSEKKRAAANLRAALRRGIKKANSV